MSSSAAETFSGCGKWRPDGPKNCDSTGKGVDALDLQCEVQHRWRRLAVVVSFVAVLSVSRPDRSQNLDRHLLVLSCRAGVALNLVTVVVDLDLDLEYNWRRRVVLVDSVRRG